MQRLIFAFLFVFCSSLLAADKKPNILFIYVEDLGYYTSERAARELNAGIPGLKTPNLDKLAARGTTFLNAHCSSPLCNPSRTSLMLGLRPTTTGIYGLAPWFRKLPELKNRVTLPQQVVVPPPPPISAMAPDRKSVV